MNETELLLAFRKERSETAFAELVRRYASLVYSVAKRRLANAALAEDITQIVFIRLARTPPTVENHGELVAWLHRTTINITIDTWRSETRRRNLEQQTTFMEPAIPGNPVWEEISPRLDEALNQLDDVDRQALLLRFFGGKTMHDLGIVLGVSEDAAKMRVSRAVDKLRTQLHVGGAACTAAVLGTMLTKHSVEAAPSHLVSRLAAMRLPEAAKLGVMGGLLAVLLRMSRFKLASGAVGVALIAASALHFYRSPSGSVPELVTQSPNSTTGNPGESASRPRRDPAGFNASAPLTPKAVKTFFHVLDAETGLGLANAEIHFAFFGPGGEGESHAVLTDNNGDAPVQEPDDSTKNGGPNVFVTAEGHVPKVVGFNSGAVPVDYTIKLDSGMTVGGMVVDEQGLPVAGVKILVQGPGNKPGQIENVDFQTCPITNREDGSWSCSYIPREYTNEIRFILEKPGYAATFPMVMVAQVDLRNLVLVISRGFAITGRVTDPQEQPVVDAIIKTLDGDHNKRRSAKTDEQGYFAIVGVQGDTETGVLFELPPLATNEFGGVIVHGIRPISSTSVPTTIATAETLHRIEKLRTVGTPELGRQQALLQSFQKMNKDELAQALPASGVQDTALRSLLDQVAVQEQELVSLTTSLGPQSAEARAAGAALDELKGKVDAQAQRVVKELDAKVSSLDKTLKQMQEEMEESITRGKAAPTPLHADLSIQAKGFASRSATVNLIGSNKRCELLLIGGEKLSRPSAG